jgi:hypothetical protein
MDYIGLGELSKLSGDADVTIQEDGVAPECVCGKEDDALWEDVAEGDRLGLHAMLILVYISHRDQHTHHTPILIHEIVGSYITDSAVALADLLGLGVQRLPIELERFFEGLKVEL